MWSLPCQKGTEMAEVTSLNEDAMWQREKPTACFKWVLTPFLECEFTLPYKFPVYREGTEQVWNSGNVKIFYFDIIVSFCIVHLLTSTLAWRQAQYKFWWLHVLVLLVVMMSDSKRYNIAVTASVIEPESGAAMGGLEAQARPKIGASSDRYFPQIVKAFNKCPTPGKNLHYGPAHDIPIITQNACISRCSFAYCFAWHRLPECVGSGRIFLPMANLWSWN